MEMDVSQDRADIQYARKEPCRCMSKPTEPSWAKLKRFVRYFCSRPRTIVRFRWQDRSNAIDVYSDANWAGCCSSRKGTSEVAVLWDGCCSMSYSKTQNTLAQSLADSELIAIVRASTEAIGLIFRAADFGIDIGPRMHVDASAAL